MPLIASFRRTCPEVVAGRQAREENGESGSAHRDVTGTCKIGSGGEEIARRDEERKEAEKGTRRDAATEEVKSERREKGKHYPPTQSLGRTSKFRR